MIRVTLSPMHFVVASVKNAYVSVRSFFQHVYVTTPIIVLVVCGLLLISLVSLQGKHLYQYMKARDISVNILARCFASAAIDVDRRACVLEGVDALLQKYTAGGLMMLLSASSTDPRISQQCQAIGHIVGSETYRLADNSLDAALRECSGQCRGACTHGVIGASILGDLGERYSGEDIAHADDSTIRKVGTKYCKDSGAECHALGHLLQLVDGTTHQAFDGCDAITSYESPVAPYKRELCYQGIFMERAGGRQSLIPFRIEATPDSVEKSARPASVSPKSVSLTKARLEEYGNVCRLVPEATRHACFQLITDFESPLFAEDHVSEASDKLHVAIAVCETFSSVDRASCFEGLSQYTELFGYGSFDPKKLQLFCDAMPTLSDREACSIGMAPRYIMFGTPGLDYCGLISEEPRQKVCYINAFQWAERTLSSWTNASFESPSEKECKNDTKCSAEYAYFLSHKSDMPDYFFGLAGKLEK